MPDHDGTGPRGGRGMGMGRGMGGGRGFRGGRGQAASAEVAATAVAAPGLVAVSARGEGVGAEVDLRFGRAAGFVLADASGALTGYLDNSAAGELGQGAGLAAAEAVARSGARTLLTGQVGPKAAAALAAAGVRVVEGCDGMTVAEALRKAFPA
jgi:predicted Fe-Mo cluster-binding NifX family protein